MLLEMIESTLQEKVSYRSQDDGDVPMKATNVIKILDDEIDKAMRAVAGPNDNPSSIKRKTELSDARSQKRIIKYSGFGSLNFRDRVIRQLINQNPTLFTSGAAKRNDLFHRVQTNFVNSYGKHYSLQFNSGKGNQGFRLEQELQDLFKKVGVTLRRAELNQSGKDLTTSVELIDNEGSEVKFDLNIEVKSRFGDNAEIYRAPLRFEPIDGKPNKKLKLAIIKQKDAFNKAVKAGDAAAAKRAEAEFSRLKKEQGQEVFREPDRLIEKAIKQSSGGIPLEELHKEPVPDDIIRLVFREKFDDYDMFYIKDGFWSTQAVENQGIFYYRYRYYPAGPKNSKHQLLICLDGLENGDEDKMGYAEMIELFNNEFIEKGNATFKEMLDKSLELVII
tara:strand:- start:513 stop:1685 length:1173 start_codon:yes stop_codon:yes gene_type:complete